MTQAQPNRTPQPSAGGGQPTVPVDVHGAAAYANTVLDIADAHAAGLGITHRFHLPGLTLAAGFCTPALRDLATRALVNDPAYAEAAQTIRLVVTTIDALPGCPRGRWAAPTYDIGALTANLRAAGLYGLYDIDHDIWQVFDPRRNLGVQLMADARRYPPWEDGFPLRHFIHWASQDAQRRLIHAGTLGVDGHGALILGAGGAGKSGTTLSGILAGMESAGDDYVLAQIDEGAIHAYPVTRVMKQDLAGLRRLGLTPDARFSGPNWQDKYLFDPDTLNAGRRSHRLRLGAILLPHIARAPRTQTQRASAREAMLALAPSSLYQLLGGWHEGFSIMAQIVRRLPVFKLALGTDPAEIAECVAALLRGEAV